MKQTPNNKATMNNKETAKQTKKQKKVEADARRRTNKRWERVEKSDRYRKAATEELCNVTINKIEIEVLDGIFLNLSIKSQVKPARVQDRILRRIVEKRQAQANHKKHGHSKDLTTMHTTLTCTSKCMEDIRKKRRAA